MDNKKTTGSRIGATLQIMGALLCFIYLGNRLFDFGLDGLPGQIVRNIVILAFVLLVIGNLVQWKTRRRTDSDESPTP